ncbi:MAG: ATP-binding cassette domain-containing protein [Bombilactobacillus mellifer]|nr:ATP-binding cassette domain-containing protein [Bombilactobacillus mellifer]
MRIILINTSFNYGKVSVINQMNLQISGVGLYTIYGKPQSGKTTLLRGLAGMIQPQSGMILVGNFNPDWDVYQNLISFWNGNQYLYPKMTGFEHLKILAKRQNRSLQDVFDVSNDLKMINYIDRPVKIYPRGIQSRFNLALSKIDDKPLILLDEPFNKIDLDSQIIIKNFLKKLAIEHLVILTTSDSKNIIDSKKVIFL